MPSYSSLASDEAVIKPSRGKKKNNLIMRPGIVTSSSSSSTGGATSKGGSRSGSASTSTNGSLFREARTPISIASNVEMSPLFRAPSSRQEPPTRDRVLGGVSKEPMATPPEEQVRPRDTRAEDESKDHLFGASVQMLKKGVKEWPIKSYVRPKHRPKPGDDSQRNVCWWQKPDAAAAGENNFENGLDENMSEVKPARKTKCVTPIPLDNLKLLLNNETAAKLAAEYLAQQRPARKRRAMTTAVDCKGILESQPLNPKPATPVRVRPGADSKKQLFGPPEDRQRASRGKCAVANSPNQLDTQGRLFGSTTLEPRKALRAGKDWSKMKSNIFSTTTTTETENNRVIPASARAVRRNPISGEAMGPIPRKPGSNRIPLRPTTHHSNPISGEGCSSLPSRPATTSLSDPRCNPITGEGYGKNKREIWVTTCRI